MLRTHKSNVWEAHGEFLHAGAKSQVTVRQNTSVPAPHLSGGALCSFQSHWGGARALSSVLVNHNSTLEMPRSFHEIFMLGLHPRLERPESLG